MDDKFLHEMRRDPDPDFARRLRGRLRQVEGEDVAPAGFRLQPVLAGALAVGLIAALFTIPSVRASAQAMLDMFRVREFAVVQVDASRMELLRKKELDPAAMLGGKLEKLQDPGPPQRFTSVDAATAAAGFRPLRPTVFPSQLAIDTVVVEGEARGRMTVDTAPLRALMAELDIRDLEVPAGLDGQQVLVHMPVIMVQSYAHERRHVAFVQANSPEISLPRGTDLPRLGEIGLRLLGLERDEAHRMAVRIDWGSTMLIPVIGSATQFQEVTVNGTRGLFVETTHTRTPDGTERGPGSAVLWSHDGRVYAMMGNIDRVGLMQMAESVR